MKPPNHRTPPEGVTPGSTIQQAFDHIYRNAVWGKNSQGSGTSGSGSTFQSTLIYRTFLQQFLKDNGIRSVVDAGCGDWQFSQTLDWSGIDYRGFDIVESVITENKRKFARPNIQFFAGNIFELDLPPADLLISKHVLQHLPIRDVLAFMPQVAKFKHVLLTNGVTHKTLSGRNEDIVTGEGRTLDPTAPPFNLEGVKALTYWDGVHMHQVVHIHHAVRNEGEARARITARGYINVNELKRSDQGFWMGMAQKDARVVHVAVDAKGNVFFRDPS